MSSELILDNSKVIFKLDKDILSFKLNMKDLPKQEPTKSTIISNNKINVTNLTDDYLAFRTKTTKRLYYNVSPTYCVIPPKQLKEINIQFILKEGEIPNFSGHKFKFEGFVIQENEKNKEPKNLFFEYTQKGQPVVGNSQKTYVQFFDNNEKEIKKSRNFLQLPENTHLRSGSDLSEYHEIDNEKNDNEKGPFLMEQIQSKEEEKPTLSDIISGNIKENNNEGELIEETKLEEKNIEDKNIEEKIEEKKDKINEIKNEIQTELKDIINDEKKDEINNGKIDTKEKQEYMKNEYANDNNNENMQMPIKRLLNENKNKKYSELENTQCNLNKKYGNRVSDTLVIISLLIAMLVGYYLVK